jgi:hypothetical protein
MAAGSGETARPASGKYVFGAHRPAAWQLTISLGKIPDLVPGGGDAATGTMDRYGPHGRHPDRSRRRGGGAAASRWWRRGECGRRQGTLRRSARQTWRSHLPVYESGTGNFNRELLYVWANDTWHDELVILKGVYPDYEKMTAETPVWRRSHRGGQRWHRQGRRMRRSLAALSSAGLPAGRPKGTNAMTGSFHIEPWDAPPKS